MSRELKPCPFCGGEAHVSEYESAIYLRYTILCNDDACRAGYNHTIGSYKTLEQAIAAWNRRAERTCKLERVDRVALIFYLSCGHKAHEDIPNFCPECGAKVVE